MFFLLPSFSVFGLPGTHLVFSTKDGIPSNETYKILQDKKGYIWIATDRGIARYDYDHFQYYGINEGLGNLLCTNMAFDKTGQLTVYCYKDGFYSYVEEIDAFRPVQIPKHLQNIIVMDFAYGDSNELNFSVAGNKFVSISKEGKIDTLEFAEIIRDNPYTSILKLNNPPLISTQHKLNYKKPWVEFKGDFVYLHDAGCYHTTRLSTGVFLATTSDELIIMDPKTKRSKILPVKTIHLESFTYEGQDLIFIGDGIYTLSEDWTLKKQNILPHYVITSALQDYEGNLWFSTHDHGVILYFPGISSLSTDEGIVSDVEAIKDQFFFTTTTGYILRMDTVEKALVKEYRFKEPQYQLKVKDGAIYNRFGNLYDPFLKKEFKTDYEEGEGRYPIITNSFAQDIQVCGLSIPKFYEGSKKLKTNISPQHREIRWSHFSSEHLYLGHSGGLSSYRCIRIGDSLVLSDFKTIEDSCLITSLALFDGKLYYSSMELGMKFLDLQTELTHSVADYCFLPTERVNAFKIYENKLLVFTNLGMFMYEILHRTPHYRLTHVVSALSGLSSSDVKNGILHKGNVILVGESSAYFIELDEGKFRIIRPKPIITKRHILNNDHRFKEGDQLKHFMNSIRVDFVHLSRFVSPTANSFKITLKRKEAAYLEFFTDEHYAQFIGLDPGKYSLEIQALNQFGKWSDPAIMSFRIKPKFTQTIWFYALIILVISMIVSLVVRNRSIRKFKDLTYQKKLDDEKIKSQEATLAKFKLQLNPHFVYNTLNSIQYLFFDNRKKEANRYINTFAGLLRTGIAHSEKRTVHISDEIDYIKAYMEIEKLRFPSKFQFRLTVEDELMEEDYEIPPQLIQPFLENAVKHAFTQANSENGIIELNIQLSDDKEYLIASILDNGIGLNLAKKSDSHNSMGISNVQKQLEILNLSSSIKSTVQLYDRSETGKESTGTIVTLRIATRIS